MSAASHKPLSPSTVDYIRSMSPTMLTRTQHASERLLARGNHGANAAIVALCKQVREERKVKDSSEYGWLTVGEAEYEKLRKHDRAGTGTPCHPERPGYWVMSMDPETGATCLWTGVTLERVAALGS